MAEYPLVPLAERMRPKTIQEYIGQHHLLGEDAPLKKCLDNGYLPSLIFWGPPGSGKTTLAYLLARTLDYSFHSISAIEAGVREIKEIIQGTREKTLFSKGKTILFVDEIHRFSKSQQDYLLGAVEKGEVVLIGATTENPSFEIIPALLSRCQVYTIYPLSPNELEKILQRAIEKDEYLKQYHIILEAREDLLHLSGGDARKMLNILEMCVQSRSDQHSIIIDKNLIFSVAQKRTLPYDKSGEEHYNTISAFIKSVRGSDPHAAVYWLARMIEAGEDPLFIARRLIILAAEDIGLANPTALVIANNAFQAVNQIGMPEGRIVLSQATLYLACSPKSNSAYKAIEKARELVHKTGPLPVPFHLRNAPTPLMQELGYGKEYHYDHDYPLQHSGQEFMPEDLSGYCLYYPASNPREEEFKKYLLLRWQNKYKYE